MPVNANPQEELTAKQSKALVGLLTLDTIKAAAEAAGVDETTVIRWMKDDPFRTAYRDARREIVNHAVVRLQGACSVAVNTLRSIAADEDKPAASRVTAARAILDASQRAVEIDDLGARVEALETVLKEQSNGKA